MADADCERRDDWLLQQDVNAWTSVGYAVVGLLLLREIRHARLPRAALALAAALIAEGLGSVLYHGSSGALAQTAHDVPIVALVGFMAGWHVGRLAGVADRGSLIGAAAGTIGGGLLELMPTGVASATTGILVATVVVAEIIARRRAMTPVWSLPLVVLLALSLAMWVAGTATSDLCAPDSLLQPHGLWHLLGALVVVAWADRAYAADRPDHPPRMLRRGNDRALGFLCVALVHAFHRSVEVAHHHRMPSGRPVLIVANHGNGFVDPVVVAGALRRLPRFLAKAALWKVFVARPFLAFAGVLPVYRSADGDRTADNRSVFDECHRDLAIGATVAIFPEGTTGDRGGLDRVRSGAARIALGALATTPDLVIVPMGLAFENRVETRSRALVMFGEPIDVATFATAPVAADQEPDRADVGRLTAAITEALGRVSPDFADVEQREILRAAARVERDETGGRTAPSFGAVELTARRLAAAEADRREEIVHSYRRYATGLELIGVHDRNIRRKPVSWLRLTVSVVALVVAAPLLITVSLIHAPAALAVVGATGLVKSTATKGTVRVLVGLVTGMVTWIIAGVVLADGWGVVATAAAVALGGAVALVVWPPLIRQALVILARLRLRDRAGLIEPLLAQRRDLAAEVEETLGERSGPVAATLTRAS